MPSPSVTGQTATGRTGWLTAALLLLLVVWVHRDVITFDFVMMDDDINIYANPHMGAPTPGRMGWMFSNYSYVRRFIPLGWLCFSTVFQYSHLSPFGYHVVGLLLHAGNTFLFYIFLTKWGRKTSICMSEGWFIGSVGLCTALWAFHPMRVESIGWVSGLLYEQAGFFALLSMLLYLKLIEAPSGRWRVFYLVTSGVFFSCSLLTYPVSLGLAVFPFLVDASIFPQKAPVPKLITRLYEKLIFLVPALLIFGITLVAKANGSVTFWGKAASLQEFGLLPRVMQAFYVAAYFIWKPFFPIHLSPAYSTLYDFNPLSVPFLLSAFAVLGTTLWILKNSKKYRGAAIFWIGYLAVMAPVLGLTEHPHFTSDRYAYFPALLISAALVILLLSCRRPVVRWTSFILGLAAVSVLAAMSHTQLGIWRNTDTLYTRIIEETDNDEIKGANIRQLAVWHFMRGEEYRALDLVARNDTLLGAAGREQLNLARRRFIDLKKISELGTLHVDDGENVSALSVLHMGLALKFLHSGEEPEAEAHLKRAIELSPAYQNASYNLALLLASTSRPQDALHIYLALTVHGFFASKGKIEARLLEQLSHDFRSNGALSIATCLDQRTSKLSF